MDVNKESLLKELEELKNEINNKKSLLKKLKELQEEVENVIQELVLEDEDA